MPNHTEDLVVFDIDGEPFLKNRVFNIELMRQYPGADAIAVLAQQLRASGIAMMTADVYLAEKPAARKTVVLGHETSRFTHALLFENNLTGAACFSGESPIISWRFYRSLPEVSSWYEHLYLFPGARDLATGTGSFHDHYWPYPDLTPAGAGEGRPRGFLAMVSANKRAFGWPKPAFDLSQPKPSAGRWFRALEARSARAKNSWMQSELYVERLAAIRHFGAATDFDLLGRGWDQPVSGADSATRESIRRSYRGEVSALGKVEKLSEYRFSLCLENTAFPGYVTEKIFDCFAAGTVPIYLGAPDIEDYIPKGSFIDLRQFSDYLSLEQHLRSMTDDEAAERLSAARTFVESNTAARYTQAHFVDRMSETLIAALRH
ncbi:MAG: hypothetical protein HGB10_02890 [Coriobacteriia bacterium]|nr:hypothetical protein [Coriobacteriia bacterium]